jgi:hypothetical protein
MGIIRFIKAFIAERGLTLMIFGISAAAAGVLLYAFLNTPRYAALHYPQAAMGLAFLGFAAYFTGRVSVAIQRRGDKRKVLEMLSRRDDESGVQ